MKNKIIEIGKSYSYFSDNGWGEKVIAVNDLPELADEILALFEKERQDNDLAWPFSIGAKMKILESCDCEDCKARRDMDSFVQRTGDEAGTK